MHRETPARMTPHTHSSQFKVHMLNGCGQNQFENEIDYLTCPNIKEWLSPKCLCVYCSIAIERRMLSTELISMVALFNCCFPSVTSLSFFLVVFEMVCCTIFPECRRTRVAVCVCVSKRSFSFFTLLFNHIEDYWMNFCHKTACTCHEFRANNNFEFIYFFLLSFEAIEICSSFVRLEKETGENIR